MREIRNIITHLYSAVRSKDDTEVLAAQED